MSADSKVKSISKLYPLIKDPKESVDKKIDFDLYFNTLVQKVNNKKQKYAKRLKRPKSV